MTRLGTLTKRSHWTIRTAILFHQHISCKVWSIVATSATLWWSVRHARIEKLDICLTFEFSTALEPHQVNLFSKISRFWSRMLESREKWFTKGRSSVTVRSRAPGRLKDISVRYTVQYELWKTHEFHFSLWHFTRRLRYDIVDFY